MKKLVAFVSIVVLAANYSAAGATPSHTGRHTKDGRIVFTGCDDVSCQIYTVNPDGSALRRVTHDAAYDFTPVWSPDGKRIAYSSAAGAGPHIHIINADGSNDHQLTPDDPDTPELWPRFTPDGRQILFTQFNNNDGGIYSVRPDGTHQRAIIASPSDGESYNEAVPSPNGKRLAFTLFNRQGIIVSVFVSKADGSHQRRITPPRLEGSGPDWSRDGRQIVFWTNRARPNSAIYKVNANGSDVDGLTHPAFPFDDFSPAYSPGADRIVFRSDRRYPDLCCSDLFTMRPNGSGMRRIPLPASLLFVGSPRWGTAPLLHGSSDRLATRGATASGLMESATRSACAGIPAMVRKSVCGPKR